MLEFSLNWLKGLNREFISCNLLSDADLMNKLFMKKLEVAQEQYEAIAQVIHSDSSPVGIDAKKTHILILEKLIQIEERLNRLERKLDRNSTQ